MIHHDTTVRITKALSSNSQRKHTKLWTDVWSEPLRSCRVYEFGSAALVVQLWNQKSLTLHAIYYYILISSVTLGKHFLLLQDAAHNDALVGWGIFGFSRISPFNLSLSMLSSTVRICHITASVQKRFQPVLQQTRFVCGPPETW